MNFRCLYLHEFASTLEGLLCVAKPSGRAGCNSLWLQPGVGKLTKSIRSVSKNVRVMHHDFPLARFIMVNEQRN